MTYLQDAASIYSSMKMLDLQDPLQKVGPYKHIYINCLQSLETIIRGGDCSTALNEKSLPELSNFFLYEILDFHPSNNILEGDHLATLSSKELYKKPQELTTRDLLDTMEPLLSPQKFLSFKNHIESLVLDKVNTFGTPPANAPHPPTHTPSPPTRPDTRQTRKRKRGNNNTYFKTSRSFWKDYENAPTKGEKLEIICACAEELKGHWSATNKPEDKKYAQGWGSRAGKINACIKHCYDGDIPSFLSACPKYKIKGHQCPKNKRHRISYVDKAVQSQEHL